MDFNGIIYNPEVFDAYTSLYDTFTKNALIQSGAVVVDTKLVSQMREQSGSNYVTTPIKAALGGKSVNYNGETDIEVNKRGSYAQSRIVIGRASSWGVEDFATDITGGEDFSAAAEEVANYQMNERQEFLLATLEGIFKMSGTFNDDFVKTHTYKEPKFTAVTLNNAIQEALGDNKGEFSLMVCHSRVATNLENLNLLEYTKYTDENGITRSLGIGTLNGRLVLVDDSMPVEAKDEEYVRVQSYVDGALLVVDSGAKAGQVNKSAVTGDIEDIEAGEYVALAPAGLEYTAYILGNNSIEYTPVGAKVPSEVYREPLKNGGRDIIIARDRFCFAPRGISFLDASIVSPELEDLKDGSNWGIAQDGKDGECFPLKNIPIVQVKTRG